jgi:excisionase family DNA binding protein
MKATPSQLAAYVGKSERTIHRWLASGKLTYTRLPGGLIDVDESQLFPLEERDERTILTVLERMERKLDDLAAIVGILAAQPTKKPPFQLHTEQAEYTIKAAQSVQSELPEGFMAVGDYCQERGYAETTVKRWIAAGKVPIHEGNWKRGRSRIRYAIDDEGKKAIDALYEK